jgi:hypothetical protein
MKMSDQFYALVQISLSEMVVFGMSEDPRKELSKFLLSAATSSESGEIDLSEATYSLAGTCDDKLLFKVDKLSKVVRVPEKVELPTKILEDLPEPAKKGFFSKLFK